MIVLGKVFMSQVAPDCGPLIIGVDEAGRGPLAGPVVAAAVVLALMNSSVAMLFEPQPVLNQVARNYDKANEVDQRWHVWNALSRVAMLSMRQPRWG